MDDSLLPPGLVGEALDPVVHPGGTTVEDSYKVGKSHYFTRQPNDVRMPVANDYAQDVLQAEQRVQPIDGPGEYLLPAGTVIHNKIACSVVARWAGNEWIFLANLTDGSMSWLRGPIGHIPNVYTPIWEVLPNVAAFGG